MKLQHRSGGAAAVCAFENGATDDGTMVDENNKITMQTKRECASQRSPNVSEPTTNSHEIKIPQQRGARGINAYERAHAPDRSDHNGVVAVPAAIVISNWRETRVYFEAHVVMCAWAVL